MRFALEFHLASGLVKCQYKSHIVVHSLYLPWAWFLIIIHHLRLIDLSLNASALALCELHVGKVFLDVCICLSFFALRMFSGWPTSICGRSWERSRSRTWPWTRPRTWWHWWSTHGRLPWQPAAAPRHMYVCEILTSVIDGTGSSMIFEQKMWCANNHSGSRPRFRVLFSYLCSWYYCKIWP